ncbi:hypothetical protein [Mycolicibacterium sp.]|uniref:hypothetical protein n=1 Tax=Mycolicibacterium sp. TaxID=2320850 RepID=UPI0037CA9966
MKPTTRAITTGIALAVVNVAAVVGLAAGQANAVTMPSNGTFIVDMAVQDEPPMTLAVTVDGDKVVGYATNGTDEEAWFFGSQHGGTVNMASMYADRIDATYDGSTLRGTLTMNDASAPHAFSAAPVAAPAGIYTATMNSSRASWVVRPDHTMIGVMDNRAPGDHRVTDQLAARQEQQLQQIRQMRIDQQMRQAPPMQFGTWSANIDSTPVTATRVSGGMRF